MKIFVQVLFYISITLSIFAQPRLQNNIKGTVQDKTAKVGLEYSNVVLLRQDDTTQVAGTITNNEGEFVLEPVRPGRYFAKVSFMGYKTEIIDDINLRRNTKLDLGIIQLVPEEYNTDEVLVSGTRSPVTYEIDKKVINVSGQITALSGNAVDLLENVPSITVDIEGNVSLRGSTNFTVLIDGKPSILEGSEALEHIPASGIENIEIITNPSAKYNPEGTAGIINIISKKNMLDGISGVANLNYGNNDRYGADVLFDSKSSFVNWNLSLDYNKRLMDMESETGNWTIFNQNRFYNNSLGISNRGRESYSIKGSMGLNLSDSDILTFNGRYGYRSGQRNSDLSYIQWNDLEPEQINFLTENNRKREGDYFSIGTNYSHNFSQNGHALSLDLIYQKRDSDEYTLYKQLDQFNFITEGQEQTEKGPSESFEIKLDYTYPISENSKFEAGYNGNLRTSDDISENYIFNPINSLYELDELLSKDIVYDRNVHSIYSIYSTNIKKLGIQLGFRTEYTDRLIELTRTTETFEIDRWDYFPSAHFSYKLDQINQLMASYSRRINRPRGWQLEPFITWMDPYNVRQGNPDLEPEYIDSYELGYQTILGKSVFSTELYYRVNNNKREYIQFAYDENTTLRTVDNVGKSYSFGSELMFNFDLFSIWNVNLMGNLYNYSVEGSLDDVSFDRSSLNWNTRFNNTVRLGASTQFQFNLFYNSPTVSAQGDREGFFMTNAAIKQVFFNKQLAVTFQVRDIFSTIKREITTSSDDFYRYNFFAPDTPLLMLNFKFNFNNYKSKDRRNGNGGDIDMNGEDF